MRTVSARLPSEVSSKIEWLKVFLYERDCIKYTTTQIIILCITKFYDDLQRDIDKKGGKKVK